MLFNVKAVALGLLSISYGALASGPLAVNLRTAGTFAVLAKTGIANVPPTAITGNIGVSPISAAALTGFSLVLDRSGTFATSTQVVGQVFAATYASPTPLQLNTAVSDMQTAFLDATGRILPTSLNAGSGLIGGLSFTPGLYKWTTGVNAATSFTIVGTPIDTWIFQIASTFVLGTGVRVILAGGALPSNIVWVVTGGVTLHVGSHLEGVVLGKTAITVQTGASVNGRLLAQTNVALQEATVVG